MRQRAIWALLLFLRLNSTWEAFNIGDHLHTFVTALQNFISKFFCNELKNNLAYICSRQKTKAKPRHPWATLRNWSIVCHCFHHFYLWQWSHQGCNRMSGSQCLHQCHGVPQLCVFPLNSLQCYFVRVNAHPQGTPTHTSPSSCRCNQTPSQPQCGK